jgi:hypothetical protein
MVQLSSKKLKPSDNIYENIETNIFYNAKRKRPKKGENKRPPAEDKQALLNFAPPVATNGRHMM